MLVPDSHDFRVGDVIKIHPTGTASLDSGFATASAVDSDGNAIAKISAIDGNKLTIVTTADAAITLIGDASGSDQTNHFEVSLSEFSSVCSIKEWSLDLSRESIDITTLPCKPCEGAGSKYATYRTTAPGYASAEGSMTVLFSRDSGSMANRLLANSMLKDQAGSMVRLFIEAVCDGSDVDLTESNYIEAPVTLNGFSVTVNTEDAVEAEINFGFSGQPTAMFGIKA